MSFQPSRLHTIASIFVTLALSVRESSPVWCSVLLPPPLAAGEKVGVDGLAADGDGTFGAGA